MKTVEIPPLENILAEIPDKCQSSGKRHPLRGMLLQAVVAILCGYRTVHAIAEWGESQQRTYQAIEDWFSEEPLRHQANPHGQITMAVLQPGKLRQPPN